MSSGSSASARAMPMRWRWPPENSCGKRLRCSRAGRRGRSSSSVRVRASAFGTPVQLERRADDLRDALARVQRGERVLEDHLHLAPRSGRSSRCAEVRDVVAVEADRCPSVGSSSRMSVRDSVVLPQPDSPTSPSVSPCARRERHVVDRVDVPAVRSMSRPCWIGKYWLDVLDLEQRSRRRSSRLDVAVMRSRPSPRGRSGRRRSRASRASRRAGSQQRSSCRGAAGIARLERRHLDALRELVRGSAGGSGSPRARSMQRRRQARDRRQPRRAAARSTRAIEPSRPHV